MWLEGCKLIGIVAVKADSFIIENAPSLKFSLLKSRKDNYSLQHVFLYGDYPNPYVLLRSE